MSSFGGRLVTASVFVAGAASSSCGPAPSEPTPAATPGTGTLEPSTALPKPAAGQVTLVDSVRRRPQPDRPSTTPASSWARVAASDGAGGPGPRQGARSGIGWGGRVRPERPSTPAGSTSPSRSARPARRSSRSSTSRAGSAAPSSTRSASRSAGTIVAIDKDREAPIAEFADLVVVGDLFEIRAGADGSIRVRKHGRRL